MIEKPLVSVVIPTYGRAAFLERCIESVIKQSYKNIEIIVVDDNDPSSDSREDTEKVVKKYLSNSRFIYLQHEKNKNGSAARNTGWKKSEGKYITFLDDDDVILPEKIRKQVECMESLNESWGACYSGYRIVVQGNTIIHSTENRSGDCYCYALMRTMFMGSGSNLFLRKQVVDEVNGYDESFQRNQDIEFLVRVLEKYKLAYVDEELLCIYQNENRVKRSFNEIDYYAQYYLSKFRSRIDLLPKDEKRKVLSVISLERCRVAFYKKEYKVGINILLQNKVSVFMTIKYGIYLLKRVLTHTSYGFSG